MIKIKINAKINNRFKDKNNKRYIILQLIHKIIEFFLNKIIYQIFIYMLINQVSLFQIFSLFFMEFFNYYLL